MMEFGLEEFINRADGLLQIRKCELLPGDEVVLRTKNSLYSIEVESDDSYKVSGGWFDKMALSPYKTTINGCTWGGSGIKTDIVAARGLFLEFGNRLLTSRIREIILFSKSVKN